MKIWKLVLGIGVLCLIVYPSLTAHAASGVVTLATFDPAKGQLPENLVFDHHGNLYLNMAVSGEIRKIAPDGTQSTLATLKVGKGNLLGLAVDRQDNVYAALNSGNSPGSDTHGIWRIRPDGTKELFAALPANGFPNQPLFDKSGNLLVTDSLLGVIWRITPTGQVSQWLSDPLLAGNANACSPAFPVGPLGANGMAFDERGALFVSNTSKALVVRIPVNPDGSPGTPSTYASSCANLDGADGLTVDTKDNVYVADNILSKVVRVNTDGTIDTIASAADGLDNVSGVAFGVRQGERTSLFMTNFAVFTLLSGGTPHPSLMRVDVGVSGARPQTPPNALAQVISTGSRSSGAFSVSFASTIPGWGEVYFGSGPGCSGLVEVATRDLSPGGQLHTVMVTGNDMPGTVGESGILPGVTYYYEVVTVGPNGTEIDNNNGSCYSVTIPRS